MRQRVFPEVFVEVLDHSSQPRRKKESNRSKYTHQYKHPEEYPVNDHGHILPVFLYLAGKRQSREGHFEFHTTQPLFLPAVSFHPWLISLEWLIFPLWGSYLLNVSQSLLVSLMKNSRSNYRGPIVPKTGLFWLEIEGALWFWQWLVSMNEITTATDCRITIHFF